MDRVDPTLARVGDADNQSIAWDMAAQQRLNAFVQTEPVLVQISVAKRLRDRAEREARRAGLQLVTADLVERAQNSLRQGEPA
jgi:chlorophyllide a reductase subunit Z